MIRRVLTLALALSLPMFSVADEVGNQFFSRNETRVFRKDSAKFGHELLALQFPIPERVAWSLTLGAAYDRGENGGHTWTTPFDLSASIDADKSFFDLTGDGYSDTRSPSGAASGLADLTAGGSHAFVLSPNASLRVGGALTFPTHGEVGSTGFAERVTAGLTQTFGQWSASLVGKVRHDNSTTAGLSHFGKAALGQLTYNFVEKKGADIVAQAIRSTRVGSPGTTLLALATDFPLSSTLGGSFTVLRGLSSGSRDTSVETDLTVSF